MKNSVGRPKVLIGQEWQLTELMPKLDLKPEMPTTIKGWAEYFSVDKIAFKRVLDRMGKKAVTITVLVDKGE
jgi:hypothetical protein